MPQAAAAACSGFGDTVRVGVDGASWRSARGYGRFLRNVGTRLMELDADTRYIVYVDEKSAVSLDVPERAEVRTVALGRAPQEAAAAESRRSAADVFRMARAVSRDRPDVFLFPSLHTYFPVVRVPTVVGIHDTIPEDHPELTFPNRRARAYSSLKRAVAMRRATRLFTVSEASRAALVDRFGLTPDQLPIVPEAPDPVFHPQSSSDVLRLLAPLGLTPGSFFVFAGGISPHKNLERLIEAYAQVARSRVDVPPLVLVGELDADPFLSASESVVTLIQERSLGERVVLPGFVSDEVLACLYSGATAVVVPSLAEGFGLPAVEAAACGAAVILSDIPAHRETLDGAAVFVEPADIAAIGTALSQVLAEPSLRSALGDRARNAVAGLSWDAAARTLRAILADAAHIESGSRG